MLELGTAGSHGAPKGEAPILRDGTVVAVLRASNWKEAATAVIGDQVWVFDKRKGRLLGRQATDAEHVARLTARQASFWKGTWAVELDGTQVEVASVSTWKGTHRFSSGGRKIAESGSTGGWAPRLTLDADDSLPLHHRVFLLWMELVLNRRNTAAVTAATSAAVFGGSS
ncbi:MAG: uncharacterized protein JWQ99_2162 [Blastococcus sp.]|jgi:hypothetical protein|nr:uncharacterized protein [Blastococcus sp.]